ncbi:bifunctional hydroxymethylpyrimidine kinase/phosphomethylpyrimidine kinase, partial [Mesorhizobium sp. BR1-1-5]|nr:bifunctional hydroxymethylpyrimidine kinase/phosphomethylpyrimidine kinase [Mesorhizobium sp. BR1-1-5]
SRLLRAASQPVASRPVSRASSGRLGVTRCAALDAARGLAAEHDVTVLLKGGHLDEAEAAEVPDAVVRVDGAVHEVRGPRVTTRASHGTGCTLSSALATLAGAGLSWEDALERAKPWLADAMRAGEALAVGDASRPTWHGPVDHGHAQRG